MRSNQSQLICVFVVWRERLSLFSERAPTFVGIRHPTHSESSTTFNKWVPKILVLMNSFRRIMWVWDSILLSVTWRNPYKASATDRARNQHVPRPPKLVLFSFCGQKTRAKGWRYLAPFIKHSSFIPWKSSCTNLTHSNTIQTCASIITTMWRGANLYSYKYVMSFKIAKMQRS